MIAIVFIYFFRLVDCKAQSEFSSQGQLLENLLAEAFPFPPCLPLAIWRTNKNKRKMYKNVSPQLRNLFSETCFSLIFFFFLP